jgi:pimeloyl-ACP methyl ester carboxylesterase
MGAVNGSSDGLSLLSNAELSESVPEYVPGVADEPPPGWFASVDGRGVFLRRWDRAEGSGADETDGSGRPSGPDAWYVHGLAGSSTNWISLAGALSWTANGYLIDLPGHGRSDPPPRGRYSLVDAADVTAALIRRHSRGPVHLVGNSLGGVVSTALAARHPELVATLTLISPAVPDLRLTRDRGADPVLGLLLVPGTGGLAVRRLSLTSPMARARGMGELCFGDPTLLTDDDYAAAAADLAWRSSVPWVHTGTIGSLRALLRSYLRRRGSFRADAATVMVPTLVIWGTRDRLVDVRLAPRTATAFPDSRLLILPGVGHTAQMEDPVTTARAIGRLWESPGASHPGLPATVATS